MPLSALRLSLATFLLTFAACGDIGPDGEPLDEAWLEESEEALAMDPPEDDPVSFDRRKPDNQDCSLTIQAVSIRKNEMCVACGVPGGSDFLGETQGEEAFGGENSRSSCSLALKALYDAMDACHAACDGPTADQCTPPGC